jgi:hypothetical protein
MLGFFVEIGGLKTVIQRIVQIKIFRTGKLSSYKFLKMVVETQTKLEKEFGDQQSTAHCIT